jgi:2,4-dienoyl-CoA reductase-like NADH-dependent reductase (Old Yellow Enzyme family)
MHPLADLFRPLQLRSVTLRNRIGMSPMCMYSAEDGHVGDFHLVHLGARAMGGAGLVIAEATAVEPRGRITPGDAGIWSDSHIAPWRRVTDFLRAMGATPALQIAHAGRKAGTSRPWDSRRGALPKDAGGWDVIAPSALPFRADLNHPAEMTRDDIRTVQGAFRDAARRALAAGFDMVELHGAHGYLQHSFLSPISNQRTDEYGGSFANRTRFMTETVRMIREVWPAHLPLAVRLSCTDWVEGAWAIEDSVALALLLKGEGVDLIDCSSGGSTMDAKIPVAPGFQVPLAERIRREAAIPVACVGMLGEPAEAERIVAEGHADVVLLGREYLRDPHWALRAAAALGHEGRLLPDQYQWAIGRKG